MYKLTHTSQGAPITAKSWNDHVDAINEALSGASDAADMIPVRPALARQGGQFINDKGGFSLRSLTRQGEDWIAYFNPGRVLEIHAGGARVIIPKIGGVKMDIVPYQSIKAEKDKKVYLDLVWGDNSHDCITSATISTQDTQPGGRSARLVLGKFVSAGSGSGASIDDITYEPYLTGCITYASGSRNEGWRVLAAADKDGQPKAAYLRRGNIYAFGKLVSEGSANWETAPAKQGDIWLTVKCDGDGNYKSFSLGTSKGEERASWRCSQWTRLPTCPRPSRSA